MIIMDKEQNVTIWNILYKPFMVCFWPVCWLACLPACFEENLGSNGV